MRLSSLTLVLAGLALVAPASAQTSPSGPIGSSTESGVHAPLAAPAAKPSKASIEADKRLLAEQKRLERIMTICTGC